MAGNLLIRSVSDGIPETVRETEEAWENFMRLGDASLGPRTFIVDSWKRSQVSGVSAERSSAKRLVDESLVGELWQEHPLRQNLLPYIQELQDTMMPSRHLVVFSDPDGMLLSLVGDSRVRAAAEKMTFVPGSNWSEDQAGTNAHRRELGSSHAGAGVCR